MFQSDLCHSGGLPEFAAADSMLCLNVLEDVPDDVLALKNMRERVNPGGKLVILVPAHPGRGLSRLYDALTPGFAVVEKHAIRGIWGLSIDAICRRRE